MHLFLNSLDNNLGILSTIKIDISCVYNINDLYFDIDILSYNNILLLFTYLILLFLLLIITRICISIRDKILVNFNESQVELYDSGDNIDCSSSEEGNYTSGDNDDDDEEIKLARRKRR